MIELTNVCKQYKDVTALNNFSYSFENGIVYGVLGINGAGKSTLINCITHNIRFKGDVKYVDLNIHQIGYVPQELAIYEELSVLDNMLFFGAMNKMSKQDALKRSMELIETVGLQDKTNHLVSTLSGGMKRKLNLITALVHHPKLLICDEVCVGIDPISRMEILEYLKQLKEEGLNIIYTSHYLEEVEFLCDRIIFLDHGSFILDGNISDLIQELSIKKEKESSLKDLFLDVLKKGE